MDDFCWLTGPGLCGKLTFHLPVVEVLVVALVSGLVTWATIYFSVKAARQETERTLAAQQSIELRAAILTLAQDADQRFRSADWGASLGTMDAHAADIIIRTSGIPGAAEAAKWAQLFRQQAVIAALDKESLHGYAFFMDTWRADSAGPGRSIIAVLTAWLMSPEKKTPELKEQIDDYRITLIRFVNRLNSTPPTLNADEDP